jgi:hypothetical protein
MEYSSLPFVIARSVQRSPFHPLNAFTAPFIFGFKGTEISDLLELLLQQLLQYEDFSVYLPSHYF